MSSTNKWAKGATNTMKKIKFRNKGTTGGMSHKVLLVPQNFRERLVLRWRGYKTIDYHEVFWSKDEYLMDWFKEARKKQERVYA